MILKGWWLDVSYERSWKTARPTFLPGLSNSTHAFPLSRFYHRFKQSREPNGGFGN